MKWIHRVTDQYLRLKGFEKSGKIYEVLGLHLMDRKLAALFGAEPIRRYRSGETDSRIRMLDSQYRGRYAEIVNLICVLLYLPIFPAAIVIQAWWIVALNLLIVGIHLMVMLIERYKRSLVEEWLTHPESLTEEPLPDPEKRPDSALDHWFFKPAKFETDKFYRAIGVDGYRKFVASVASVTDTGSDEITPPNELRGSNRDFLDAFEEATRTSEKVHWMGVVEQAPFWFVFIAHKQWVTMIYVVFLAYMNMYAIFLQRHHRVRLYRVLLKRRAKQQS